MLNDIFHDAPDLTIKVIGVGDGGCNAVKHMIDNKIVGVEFIAANTNALEYVDNSIIITEEIAQENRDEIVNALKGADVVFVVAGMGGKIGTGAAPVVAACAKEVGAFTIGLVTRPFAFEGADRIEKAVTGIENFHGNVDALITIPNDNALRLMKNELSITDAFKVIDDILMYGVKGFVNLVVEQDIDDLKNIFNGAEIISLSIGKARGENAVVNAIKAAVNSPLLEVNIKSAANVVMNIIGASGKISLIAVSEASMLLQNNLAADSDLLWSVSTDDTLGETVTVIIYVAK